MLVQGTLTAIRRLDLSSFKHEDAVLGHLYGACHIPFEDMRRKDHVQVFVVWT